MTTCAIIPIKAPELGKTRLRSALSDEQRRALIDLMLRNVIEAVRGARGIDAMFLLGPQRASLSPCIVSLADAGDGLNAALTSASRGLSADVTRLLIIAADLPDVASADIERLVDLPAQSAAIAPDRWGAGTNALSLPLPQARDFRFQFGRESFALHCAELERLGLAPTIIRSNGLAFDIDEPSDLDAFTAASELSANTNVPAPFTKRGETR